MNKTKIDWPGLTHTLNPVVGCLRGCWYCYAMEVHTKRHKAYLEGKLQHCPQYAKPFNVLQWFSERIDTIPQNPKKPMKIFLNSVSDICFWEDSWLLHTLETCYSRPNVNFMFCTRDVKVYHRRHWPKNCQLGVTLTGKENSNNYNYILKKHPNNWKFASIEPLLGKIEFDLSIFDLVIVGAMTGPGAFKPKKEWIESIKHPNIHYKNNIKKYL